MDSLCLRVSQATIKTCVILNEKVRIYVRRGLRARNHFEKQKTHQKLSYQAPQKEQAARSKLVWLLWKWSHPTHGSLGGLGDVADKVGENGTLFTSSKILNSIFDTTVIH